MLECFAWTRVSSRDKHKSWFWWMVRWWHHQLVTSTGKIVYHLSMAGDTVELCKCHPRCTRGWGGASCSWLLPFDDGWYKLKLNTIQVKKGKLDDQITITSFTRSLRSTVNNWNCHQQEEGKENLFHFFKASDNRDSRLPPRESSLNGLQVTSLEYLYLHGHPWVNWQTGANKELSFTRAIKMSPVEMV